MHGRLKRIILKQRGGPVMRAGMDTENKLRHGKAKAERERWMMRPL
jgi:hypothetical protein